MIDLMIDIETLGSEDDCVVTSIGAVYFDIAANKLGNKFYAKLRIQDQLNNGRKITESTLKWWLSQDTAVFKDVLTASPEYQTNRDVLQKFSEFVIKDSVVWGHGSTFDISIMESLYKTYNKNVPWKFRDVMDLRTFIRFIGKGEKVQISGIKHNALDDAIGQALYVLKHTVEAV